MAWFRKMAVLAAVLAAVLRPELKWILIQLWRGCVIAPFSALGSGRLVAWTDQAEMEVWDRWEAQLVNKTSPPLDITLLKPSDLVPGHVDTSRPLLVKNWIAKENLTAHPLSINNLLREPFADVEVDYFKDARAIGTTPNGKGKIADIVSQIVAGGPQMLRTQMIVESQPEILHHAVLPGMVDVWGDHFKPSGLMTNGKPGFLTAPVFMGRGLSNETRTTTRTDFHTEPIANLAIQLEGSKTWSLVCSEHSHLMRPTLDPDGRAFVASMVNPFERGFDHVPRYEIVTEPGDVLWIPPYTWHQVKYMSGVTSLSLSLFHVRPLAMFLGNPLYTMLLMPRMISEAFHILSQ